MAFPTTSVLDNFDRANTGPPLSANWSTIGWASAGMQVASNLARGAQVSVACGEYYNVATYGADTEVYVTLNAKATAGDYASFTLDGRISSPGSGANIDSYELEIVMREGGSNVNIARIWKGINGSYSQLGADISTTVSAGDSFGLEITGGATTTISYYRKPAAGSWGLVASRTDSSSPITAAGNISLGTYESTLVGTLTLNDFGGGTVAAGGTEYTQSASGAVTPAGALARRPSKGLAGAITPAGVLTRRASKILSGAITPAGTLTRQVSKFFAGAVGLAGGVANQAQKVLVGAVTPAGALTRQAQKVFGGSITPIGTITAVRTILAAVAGTLSLSGTLSKRTDKTFAGDITPAGGLINQAQKILAGAMGFTGSLSRQTGKALAGDIIPAGAVTAVRTIIASLSGTLSFSGTLSKQTGKVFGGEIAPAGALTRQVSLLLTGVLSFSGTLAKHTSKALVGTLSLAGTLAGDLVSSAIHYVVATLFLPQGASDLELPQGTDTLHLPDGAADVEG